ncbi:hypothetical protein [Actinomadura formosensis]|uniref:hypothetical protein n=1 Tax=Actinomadura formosensis TaxID=60706 RepID=UPI003D919F75
MAMTIGEAQAVMQVLRWITGNWDKPDWRIPSPEQARTDAMWLADRASKVLGAGLNAGDVAEHWPDMPPAEHVAHLKERVAELGHLDAGIKSITTADGTIDMDLSLAHDLMRIFVASFVEILDAADAPNFVELMFKLAGTDDRYTVTIRRPHGETPGEVLGRTRRNLEFVEQAIEAWQDGADPGDTLRAIRDQLAGKTPGEGAP